MAVPGANFGGKRVGSNGLTDDHLVSLSCRKTANRPCDFLT